MSDEELYEMLDEADKDKDGMISKKEFYRVMRKRDELDAYFDSDSGEELEEN